MTSSRRRFLSLLVVVWTVTAALLIPRIDRGWVPHDEGTIAHAAERVLAGELPHRDFDDVYTGGLAYLNAAAMRVLGVNLRSPRILLVAAFLLCVPVFYYAATRFTSPLGGAAVTLLAVLWSIPNYVAALPSWYNLIFAVAGIAALLRFVDTNRRRWLVAAGVCGGLSFLIKLVGLYFVAAAVLFLILREQSADPADATSEPGPRGGAYRLVVASGLVLFVLALGALIGKTASPDLVIHFLVPGAALAFALVWSERSLPQRRDSLERFRALARLLVPFGVGLALPIALFLAPYIVSGSVDEFVRGVFIAPARRLTNAALTPLGWTHGLPTLTLVVLGVAARWLRGIIAWVVASVLAAAAAYMVVAAGSSPETYRAVFYAPVLLPVVTVIGAAAIVAGVRARPAVHRQRIMIVAAGVATFALIQFPFAAPIYFCYLTPLLALLAVALVKELDLPSPAVPATLAATYIAFAAVRVHPGFIYALGVEYQPYESLARLELPRGGGVRVPPIASQVYERLVAVMRERAGDQSAYVYAAPDAPEVYFLTGLRNPTRTLFDFFDDPSARTERVLAALREHDVRIVAINTAPDFSPRVPDDLRAALEREYPLAGSIAHFEVRWRDGAR